MSARLRITVALVNAAARVGSWLLETYAPSTPPGLAAAMERHPAGGREPVEQPETEVTFVRGAPLPTERECAAIAAFYNGWHTEEDWAVIEGYIDTLMWEDELTEADL